MSDAGLIRFAAVIDQLIGVVGIWMSWIHSEQKENLTAEMA